MVHNQARYDQAIEFRKRGFTYSEIAKIVGVSKGTVCNWCARKSFSKQVKHDNTARAVRENKKRLALINKARNAERTTRYREAERSAEVEYRHYRTSPLFIAGLMVYLAEGDLHHESNIRMANVRIESHRILRRFLVEYLGVEKTTIRFWLLLCPYLDESRCVRVWSKKLGLIQSQWYVNQVVAGRSTKRTLHNGVGNTIICSTVLKKKLIRWIELASKELQN